MATKTLAVSGVMYTDQRDWYPDPGVVARLHSSSRPFVSELFDMTPREAPDVDYKMFQKEPNWREQLFQINNASNEAWDSAGAPADTNTVTVDGAVGLTIDDSIKGQTFEVWDSTKSTFRGVVRVQSVTNSTTVVLESLGNPDSTTEAIATLQDDDYLINNGSAHGETSTSPEADSQDPEVVWNSLQHFRTSLELSFDVINSALRGVEGAQSKLSEDQTDKMDEHMIKLERGMWTGYRRGGTGGTAYGADSSGATSDTFDATHIPNSSEGRVRTTMGYITAVRRYGIRSDSDDDQSYFARAKGSYTFSQFTDDTEKIFSHTDPDRAGEKDAYCGPGAYSFWTKFVLENQGASVQLGPSEIDGRFGYHFRRLDTPHGSLRLIKCADWKGRYTNHMAVPTKKFLGLRVLQGAGAGNASDPGRIGYFPDIKKDDRPLVRKDEYHSHVGLEIRHIKSQALFIFS